MSHQPTYDLYSLSLIFSKGGQLVWLSRHGSQWKLNKEQKHRSVTEEMPNGLPLELGA